MGSNFYSCPNCKKQISYSLESNSLWVLGTSAYTKKKCDFCNTAIAIDFGNLLCAIVFTLFLLIVIYFSGKYLFLVLPSKLQMPIGVLVFALSLPCFFLGFHVGIPWLLGITGINLYKENKS